MVYRQVLHLSFFYNVLNMFSFVMLYSEISNGDVEKKLLPLQTIHMTKTICVVYGLFSGVVFETDI